jgi:hypothetical protein
MAWFKVDDAFHSHPKPKAAGRAAVGLWTVCGAYSSAYKLDGFVPDTEITTASDRRLADKLVEVGLWHRAQDKCPCKLTTRRTGGWYFHDWSDFQPTAEEIEQDRKAARERQRKSRERRRMSQEEPPPET